LLSWIVSFVSLIQTGRDWAANIPRASSSVDTFASVFQSFPSALTVAHPCSPLLIYPHSPALTRMHIHPLDEVSHSIWIASWPLASGGRNGLPRRRYSWGVPHMKVFHLAHAHLICYVVLATRSRASEPSPMSLKSKSCCSTTLIRLFHTDVIVPEANITARIVVGI
jgi:hypothetical protein